MRQSFHNLLLAGVCLVALTSLALPAVAAAADGDAATVEELVVTSQRAAEARSVDAERASNNLIEVLSATDAGKLPDQNVAEALRRLPAISVANDQGEGRYVIIRGVNPNLANVTVNGATAAVPEPEGRQIKLDDVPSSLIGKVQVIKSLTADLDANAIAGQVDIDTLTAFDKPKPFAYIHGAYGKYDMNGKNPYEGDATAGSTFADGKFGVVVSANYSLRPIESQNFGASGPTFATVGGFTVPTLGEFRDYNLTRKRQGLTANFDYRPSEDVQLYLRTLYSKFSDNETRDRFRIDNESAFTGQTATTGTFKGRGIAYIRRRQEDDNTRTFLGGGKFKTPIGDLVTEVGYSRAEKIDPLRSEVQFRTGGSALTVTYDLSNPLYVFTPSANFFDPATYTAFNSVNYDHRKAVDILKQAKADLTIPMDSWGDGSSLKIGAKILDRNKTNNRDIETYNGGATPPTLSAAFLPSGVTIYDGRYTLGPRVDYNAFQALVTANPARLVLSPAGTIGNSLVNDYDANEKVYAAYAMATLKLDKLIIIPGIRVEKTEGDYKAKTITAASTVAQGYNVSGDFSYTDVFPGVNVRYNATDSLVLRGAVTTAIGRPNFADLAPYVSVDVGAPTVSLGNPGLKPLKSVNFDASAEYYLPGHGVLSVGFFYKNIDNPTYSSVRGPTAGEAFAGIVVPAATQITQPVNADKAKISGVEFNLSAPFTFLPAPFDGLGFSANATIIDGKASGVPGRTGDVPLPLQSKRVASAQIFYEKAGFAARVAYSSRSSYLLLAGATAAGDNIVADYHSVDARVSYTLGSATVFLEGSNLNDEPYRIYLGTSDRVIENERYGYSTRLGVQLAF